MMRFLVLATAVLLSQPGGLVAQDSGAPPADAPRVYLDCSYFCDTDYLRTEMKWVNWVRDQADAQVHVLVTRQGTGGGGGEFKLNFIGLKERQGKSDTLTYVSSQNDSEDEVRQGLARVIKAGLVPYLMNTSLAARLQISMGAPAANTNEKSSGPQRDPWNYWVFSTGVRSNMDGESSQKFSNYNGNLSANRTTAGFKIRIGINGSYNESSFSYKADSGNDTTLVTIRRSYGANILAVKSVGDHWSGGFESGASSATFGNISLGLSGGPAIEFSLWPYSEATRRSLAFRYSAGIKSFDYREITIFDKMKETHPSHHFTAELNLRQRWGSTSFSTNFSQYLHDMNKYNASIFGNANVRLFKGFSIDFYGEYARVRDQLSLPGRELSDEEVLTRQRQLETSYRYWGGFGIRYSFGSIFNNVVNPRFGEGGGGMIIM